MATVTAESLAKEIASQSALLAELRKQQAEEPVIEDAKQKLGELKREQGVLQAQAASSSGAKDAGKKRERLLLKTPKVRLGSWNR